MAELTVLALEHQKARKWDAALPILKDLHSLKSVHLGEDSLETLDALRQLAVAHTKLRQFADAIPLFERRLELCEDPIHGRQADLITIGLQPAINIIGTQVPFRTFLE